MQSSSREQSQLQIQYAFNKAKEAGFVRYMKKNEFTNQAIIKLSYSLIVISLGSLVANHFPVSFVRFQTVQVGSLDQI